MSRGTPARTNGDGTKRGNSSYTDGKVRESLRNSLYPPNIGVSPLINATAASTAPRCGVAIKQICPTEFGESLAFDHASRNALSTKPPMLCTAKSKSPSQPTTVGIDFSFNRFTN